MQFFGKGKAGWILVNILGIEKLYKYKEVCQKHVKNVVVKWKTTHGFVHNVDAPSRM